MRRFVIVTLVCLAAGCSQTSVAQNDTKLAAASSAVKLDIKSYDDIVKIIEAHKGKVVVVDAWSTSCPPCMKEFPGLVALHKKHGPDKVACISLSCDFEGIGTPEKVQPKVLAFLTEQGATFQNFLGKEDSDTLFRKLDIPSIPAAFIYGKDGQLAKKFDSEFTYAQVTPIVDELLKK